MVPFPDVLITLTASSGRVLYILNTVPLIVIWALALWIANSKEREIRPIGIQRRIGRKRIVLNCDITIKTSINY
jgi:hypothetical protein